MSVRQWAYTPVSPIIFSLSLGKTSMVSKHYGFYHNNNKQGLKAFGPHMSVRQWAYTPISPKIFSLSLGKPSIESKTLWLSS